MCDITGKFLFSMKTRSETCRQTELRSFNLHYIPGLQDEGALLCWTSVFTCQLLSCCDVHCRKTCKNLTEPSNNISTDTFICVWYHTESVCSQESQPVTLMLHSGDMRKMGEKRFHFIIWFTSALRLLKLFRNVRLSDFLTSGETKQVCIHDL